jgi:hypothetical protein
VTFDESRMSYKEMQFLYNSGALRVHSDHNFDHGTCTVGGRAPKSDSRKGRCRPRTVVRLDESKIKASQTTQQGIFGPIIADHKLTALLMEPS